MYVCVSGGGLAGWRASTTGLSCGVLAGKGNFKWRRPAASAAAPAAQQPTLRPLVQVLYCVEDALQLRWQVRSACRRGKHAVTVFTLAGVVSGGVFAPRAGGGLGSQVPQQPHNSQAGPFEAHSLSTNFSR